MIERIALYISIIALVAACAWMDRYQVSGISVAGIGAPGGVVLDRWTGRVEVCYFEKERSECQQVRPAGPMQPRFTF